jgi:hypothetical protein
LKLQCPIRLQVDREIEERARGLGAGQDDRIDSADGVRDADAQRVREEVTMSFMCLPLLLLFSLSRLFAALPQVNKLRDSIQSITRTTGPLSSCVDFVQEVRSCPVFSLKRRLHSHQQRSLL